MSRNVWTAARGIGERRLSSSLPGYRRDIASRVATAPGVISSRSPSGRGRRDRSAARARNRGSEVYWAMSLAAGERKRTEIQILRTPAEHGGVHGDDQRCGPAVLRSSDHRVDQLLVGRPVELVPERCRPHRPRRVLHRVASLAGEHIRRARRGGAPGDLHIAVGADQPRGTDRGDQQGCRQGRAQDLGPQLTAPHAVQHPRHDPPAVEGVPVVPHGPSVAGPAGHVRPGASAHRPSRPTFQRLSVGRHPRPTASRPIAVDPALTSPSWARIGRLGALGGGGCRHGSSLGTLCSAAPESRNCPLEDIAQRGQDFGCRHC